MAETIAPSTGTINTDQILADVFKQYPKLAVGNDPTKTKLLIAPLERIAAAKTAGSGRLEYWPPLEEGTTDFKHPAPGNTAIEVYDSKLRDNPELLKQAVFGDLLHGMRNDPEFDKYRQEFKGNFTPQSIAMEQRQGNRSINDSRLDEYIRGYISPDENAEFLNAYKKGEPIYSQKQIELLNKMKEYLGVK